jgi:hypothetical protein
MSNAFEQWLEDEGEDYDGDDEDDLEEDEDEEGDEDEGETWQVGAPAVRLTFRRGTPYSGPVFDR